MQSHKFQVKSDQLKSQVDQNYRFAPISRNQPNRALRERKMEFSVDEQEGIEAQETEERIYIGGLGEGITNDDLRKIFSTVGEARGVDIIRTKGRSFAYIDFLPSSLNSIPKLFSTYNGCAWKGGRLRLAKAKEHYLDRLKREREEVAQTEHEPENREEEVVELSEKKQLRIFFPRLRKAKCVPLSGTGKHKYSFQRVEPHLLPLHICDCEEHSVRSDTAVAKQSDWQEENEVIIDGAEIGMMNSVMDRLFERERIAHDTRQNSYGSIQNQVINQKADVGSFRFNMLCSRKQISAFREQYGFLGAQNYVEGSTQLSTETFDNGVLSKHGKNKKLHADEEDNRKEVESIIPEVSHHDNESQQELEESETDEDGLILNVLSAANSRIGLSIRKKDSASLKQELSQDVHKERPNDILPPKRTPPLDERDGSGFMFISSGKNGDAEKENHAGGLAQSIKDLNVGRYGSRKSSLKALFGDKGNTTFSLSSILRSSDSMTKGQGLSNNLEADSHRNMNKMEPVTEEVLKNPSLSSNKKRKSANAGSDANETMYHRKKGNSQNHSHGVDTAVVAQHSEPEVITEDSSPIAPKDHKPISDGETLDSNPEPAKSTDTEAKSMKHEKPPGEYGRGSSWLHQSSWVQLVSENNATTFSLSKILPCSSANQDQGKSDEDVSKLIDDVNSAGMNFGNKRRRHACAADGFSQGPKSLQVIPETVDEQTSVDHNEFSTPVVLESELGTTKTSAGDSNAGETCLFMRNAASLKQWGKFKAAFRESNKKRSKQEEK